MDATQENTTTVGDEIKAEDGTWFFGGNTPKSFNEHVRKSVPYYLDGHDLTLAMSNYFVQPDSVGYEIGSSTGVLTRKLAEHYPSSRWVGLDITEEMVDEAGKSSSDLNNVSFEHISAADYDFEPSDFIVSYYTMQFVRPRQASDYRHEGARWAHKGEANQRYQYGNHAPRNRQVR